MAARGGDNQPQEAGVPAAKGHEPDRQLMERWLDNQTQELALKRDELQIHLRSIDAQQANSEQAVKAQVLDRQNEREFKLNAMRVFRSVAWVPIVGLFALCAYAMHLGKEGVILESLKTLAS